MKTLENKILFLTKSVDYLQNPEKQARIKKYEKEIDQLLDEFYGLTGEWIKITGSRK